MEIASKNYKVKGLVRETVYGIVNEYPECDATIALYDNKGGNYYIEWDIPEVDEFAGIGIFCHDDDKVVNDYDGVFELSEDIIEFLEENGFNCEEVKVN